MNKKHLLQDLTDQLSESGNLKKKDAEEFLKAFFKVIEESLFQGKVVKIQGLGSFKLLQVDSRKSVNVSTGEEFEIKEHYKITFTPDAALKDVVNRPFSHLDPVELDGPSQRNISSSDNETESSEKDFIRPEKNHFPERETFSERRKPILSVENKRDIKQSREPKNNHPKNNAGNQRPKPDLGKYVWIFIILLIIGFTLWAIVSNKQAKSDSARKLKEIQQLDSATYEEVGPEEFASVIEDSLKLEAEIAAKVESMAIAEKSGKSAPAAVNEAKSVEKPPVKQIVKTIDKAPVKTASNVSGIKFPVYMTMGQGDMLTVISLKYYGHKAFWVYIYLANKNVISDPNHVPLGTKIRIPSPDPSKINANDVNCIAKAKALQTKILSMN